MDFTLRDMPCLGVAGNFTGHLEQAGEASDFAGIFVADKNAPKAVFPTYIPLANKKSPQSTVPDFLRIFPFSTDTIHLLEGQRQFQIEPECAIIFEANWNKDGLCALNAVAFAASNDCSIRREGAKKISLKKNWGKESKGLSANIIGIDRFAKGGVLDRYNIASYLVREGKAYEYGENSPVAGYTYFYAKLSSWLINTINTQKDEGPAEPIHAYLAECGTPRYILVSVGATRYTPFGENTFLQEGDTSVVVLYPSDKYSTQDISNMASTLDFRENDISALCQKVICQC